MQKRLWIVLCLFVSLTVAAQSPHKSASESSCARAREVLEAGIKAMGGLDALRAINNISREMSDAKSVIERAAVATHTLRPDALSRSPRAPVIETVKGKRVFDDGAHRVELYEFSNPHCAELHIHNVNSIDLWLGGAHPTADNLWRWDEQNRRGPAAPGADSYSCAFDSNQCASRRRLHAGSDAYPGLR